MEVEAVEDVTLHDVSPTDEEPPVANPEGTLTEAQASSAESIKLQNNLKQRKRTKTGCLSES